MFSGAGPFSVGPLTVYTYGVLLASAYLLGLQLAIFRARKAGVSIPPGMLDLGVYLVIAALLGAELLLLILDFDYFLSSPGRAS